MKEQTFFEYIDVLAKGEDLPDQAYLQLFSEPWTPEEEAYAFSEARKVREAVYGKAVYLRGLIEFTNYCRNDCYYCGIRRSNKNARRYRLDEEQILSCCAQGYQLGFRTFVLQGGEDPWYNLDRVCSLVEKIRAGYPDCAITLSIGEWERSDYQAMYDAGANRYLLRHETANEAHYRKLHPENLSCERRKQCLRDLKEIGFQTGCGMMVGSPFQQPEDYLADFRFMKELQPQMIGIGPFIPHKDTPFRDHKAGTLEDTLHLLALLRLTFHHVLLPATTALGTIDPRGREKGMLAGANVVMPNLSPTEVRSKYLLYDGKICTGDEAAECHRCMEMRMRSVGYEVVTARGDYIS